MKHSVLIATVSALVSVAAQATTTAPNDPFFHQQWSLSNDGSQTVMVDLDDLHTVTQMGIPGVDIGWLQAMNEISGLTASPVTVAVIDSGIDPKHPDLQGRIRSDGWDFLSKTAILSDDVGHGTHVSGIIAANAGNATGIAGIAPAAVSILPLRILAKSFTGFTYNNESIADYAADAIRYAVAHGASVINMSLGWPKVVNTDNVRNAVNEAIQKGVLIVVAAGNDRKDEPTYPCTFEGVLCVGSITNTGAMAYYSNSGGVVDVLAPGDGIVSLYPSGVESSILRIQGYEMLSGTSQAAPHVAGMAAAIKSVNPGISLAELKARLLLSGAALPSPGSALYGLANLQRALDAKPQPVFLPDFKSVEEIPVTEPDLRIQGTLAVQNLWAQASGVQARIVVNGQPAGSAQAATLGSGASLHIPWSYRFGSLDDSSDVQLSVSLSAAGGVQQTFAMHFSAARAMQGIRDTKTIAVPNMDSWIGNTNGHLFSRLSAVNSAPPEAGLPRYYQQLGTDNTGTGVQIFDPSAATQVTNLKIPSIQRVTQVMRMDVTGSGTMDWIVTGLGSSQGQVFFQLYFMGPDFQPLWGNSAASAWQVSLNTPAGQAVVRNYSAPGSWIRGTDGRLLPCFLSQGQLPDPDNFNRLDPRRYKSDTHLYYLLPGTVGTTAVPLQVRALDNSDFRQKNSSLHFMNVIPSYGIGRDAGHLRVLLNHGDDLNAQSELWDIRSVADSSFVPAPGWDSLSSSGQALHSVAANALDEQPVFLSFFDPTRASLAWASQDGQFTDRSEFAFSSPQDPIAGLIGAFNLPGLGRFWFVEARFDMVAYHQSGGAAAETRTLPIERDSTFPGQQFSEMFTPVVVGTSAQPLPGVYIDSTLVRGNRVSIAVWNTASSGFEKPLRYSLQIPDSCIQMAPAQLNSQVESFALPLLCKQGNAMEFRAVHPDSQAGQ